MGLSEIDLEIKNGSFYKNKAILDFIQSVKSSKGTAHIIGILSDGGVHGHIEHLLATLRVLSDANLEVALHLITDGRDVSPVSSLTYAEQLLQNMPDNVKISTVIGRYYALDRDNRWERITQAYDAIIKSESEIVRENVYDAINSAYADNLTDEFIPATVINGYGGVKDGDGVFCLNFRSDRAREILSAIGDPSFNFFESGKRPKLSSFLGMVEYSTKHNSFMKTCYPKKAIENTLGEWVAKHGKSQFRVAETEKYPHVTFFLNGGRELPFDGERRHMPPSPNNLQPEMSSAQVTESLVTAIENNIDLIVVNYANPDMVGHTGDFKAAVKACEAVDYGLGKLMAAIKKKNGCLVLTADHGNCELMVDPETKKIHTAHTTNLVPFAIFGARRNITLRESGKLADVAPTILDLMGLNPPEEMTGKSMIEEVYCE
jgi:2,3-bisphosphoglycerate-independent phosphoglycerate mutase